MKYRLLSWTWEGYVILVFKINENKFMKYSKNTILHVKFQVYDVQYRAGSGSFKIIDADPTVEYIDPTLFYLYLDP